MAEQSFLPGEVGGEGAGPPRPGAPAVPGPPQAALEISGIACGRFALNLVLQASIANANY